MVHKEPMVDNQYVRRNGHLCKDVIIEEVEGMTSSYVAHKTKDLLLLRGARPLTACRRDWS